MEGDTDTDTVIGTMEGDTYTSIGIMDIGTDMDINMCMPTDMFTDQVLFTVMFMFTDMLTVML